MKPIPKTLEELSKFKIRKNSDPLYIDLVLGELCRHVEYSVGRRRGGLTSAYLAAGFWEILQIRKRAIHNRTTDALAIYNYRKSKYVGDYELFKAYDNTFLTENKVIELQKEIYKSLLAEILTGGLEEESSGLATLYG